MRIVEYSTHSGYGNQVQALLTAVFIAKISDRTLWLRPPHDYIAIDGTRRCTVQQGISRQQRIFELQRKIGSPHRWDNFDRIFEIPVKYSIGNSQCKKVHPVVKNLTCELKDCASSVSAIRSITDNVLCLGSLSDHHTKLLSKCAPTHTMAQELWDNGLKPKRMQHIRKCTCDYVRLSDYNSTPGHMTSGECPFDCMNDVWRDQVCCATCENIRTNSKSSFWQQIQRLHRRFMLNNTSSRIAL